MSVTSDLNALRRQERERFKQLEATQRETVTRPAPVDPVQLYPHMGIAGVNPAIRGYIRYVPQDFIVEEVLPDGSACTIEPESQPSLPAEGPTIYADVVKIGLGTPEAINHLASALGIPPQAIGYAGLKDSRALTSQRMSLRRTTMAAVQGAQLAQVMVKIKSTGKGAVSIGQLRGNRFTIVVRTERAVLPSDLETLSAQLQTDGFANFYGQQRFGNRLLNPRLGRALCRGDVAKAIKLYLTQSGPFDLPLFQQLRRDAAAVYGRWEDMQHVFEVFPYTFRHEIALLGALQENPTPLIRALYAIADQVKFWVYGYTSFLVNQLLSEVLLERRELPDPLPLALGGSDADALYQEFLEADGTFVYPQHLRPLRFLQQKYRTIQPWITPQIHAVKTLPAGAIISFTLPKAAYATTFLMFLFQLYEGNPVPAWVKADEVDAKAVLGTGSVAATLPVLNVPDEVIQPR